MDDSARWMNQSAAAQMNGYNDSDDNAGNTIDLTLKLGLPTSSDHHHHQHHNLGFDQMAMAPSHLANLNIENALYSYGDQVININEFPSAGYINIPQAGFNNPNEVARPDSSFTAWRSNAQHGSGTAALELGLGLDSANNNDVVIGPSEGSSSTALHHPQNRMAHQTQLGAPARRARSSATAGAPEAGSSSSSPAAAASSSRRRTGGGSTRRARAAAAAGTSYSSHDPFKRCANHSCSTDETPMWRRGPSGPKTLCNACGIKYRKEEEKKAKAREALLRSAVNGVNGDN